MHFEVPFLFFKIYTMLLSMLSKYRWITILGFGIVLVEVLGFTDAIKEYAVTILAMIIVLLSIWLYSESKGNKQ